MQTYDPSTMIVLYNLVVGILIMLSSEKLASFAGKLSGGHARAITRYSQVAILSFGAVVAVISASIYFAFHVLKIGV